MNPQVAGKSGITGNHFQYVDFRRLLITSAVARTTLAGVEKVNANIVPQEQMIADAIRTAHAP